VSTADQPPTARSPAPMIVADCVCCLSPLVANQSFVNAAAGRSRTDYILPRLQVGPSGGARGGGRTAGWRSCRAAANYITRLLSVQSRQFKLQHKVWTPPPQPPTTTTTTTTATLPPPPHCPAAERGAPKRLSKFLIDGRPAFVARRQRRRLS
jgi:hypothetical protein